MRRYGIVLGVVAVTAMAGAGPRLNAATGPRLRAISTTSGARPAVLIEASEPVAYVSARPDPFTVLVDLRNVAASGYANGFVPEAGSPVRSISVEPARGDGSLMVLHFKAVAPNTGTRVSLQMAAVGANGASMAPTNQAPLTIVVG